MTRKVNDRAGEKGRTRRDELPAFKLTRQTTSFGAADGKSTCWTTCKQQSRKEEGVPKRGHTVKRIKNIHRPSESFSLSEILVPKKRSRAEAALSRRARAIEIEVSEISWKTEGRNMSGRRGRKWKDGLTQDKGRLQSEQKKRPKWKEGEGIKSKKPREAGGQIRVGLKEEEEEGILPSAVVEEAALLEEREGAQPFQHLPRRVQVPQEEEHEDVSLAPGQQVPHLQVQAALARGQVLLGAEHSVATPARNRNIGGSEKRTNEQKKKRKEDDL